MIQSAKLPADLPPDEEERRLQALRRYDILDTPPDGAFDRVMSLAARLFDVPISIVTLVDRDRIWFKSKRGVDVEEIGRDPGLCASAVLQNGPWLLPDAKADPRLIANPLVAGEFGLRFYLGVPLTTWDGCNLGTLCVIDRAPRRVSDAEIQHLSDLASLVMDQMELRLTARQAVSERDMLLRELHHRVKNNLQILLTIVSSAERRAKGAETVSFMRSMRGRVLAMGSAHEAIRSAESMASGRTGQLLGDVAETIRAALGADGDFVDEIEDHEVSDEVLLPLALILNELLTNAFKYGASEGVQRISASFRRRGGEYELTVRDSGPGFALSDAGEQSSGLHFVRGARPPDRWSFRCQERGRSHLLCDVSGVIPATRTVAAPDKCKRILIVEDEFLIACECEFILSEADHEVVGIAACEQEAVKVAEESRPDLVLMDIRLLRGGDGIKAAHAILERCGIRCIFVSAHGEMETRARGVFARPVGWLTKPYTAGTLLAAIDRADQAGK